MRSWLAGLGVTWPTGSDWIVAAAAIAAAALAWIIALFAARLVGPRLAGFF